MKKNVLQAILIGILSTSVVSCVQKKSSSTNNSNTSSVSGNESVSSSSQAQESTPEVIADPNDVLDAVPSDVQQFRGEIDILTYIEGQNGTMEDIGNAKYTTDDIFCHEMVPYVAAAKAFKEVAPGVKINLIYCSINEYNNRMLSYSEKKGHLPHLMWGVDHVVEMIQNGYYCDISKFCGEEKFDAYYDSFNEYLMSRFNFGGFQAAVPIASEPWGMFANLSTLKEYSVVDYEDEDTYQDWVDNLTWENFLEACKNTTTTTHAGVTRVVDYLTSYSAPSINAQFLEEGTVELDNDLVKQLIQYEQDLTEYTVFAPLDTGDSSKSQFPEAHNWSQVKNFCADQYATFYTEGPWSISTISKYCKENECNIKVDFLPYPKATEDTPAYTGIAVEGIGVGNLCPIGSDGKEHCYSNTAELEEKVAAFFALFMSSDVRSIEKRATLEYRVNDIKYTGSLSLPLVKKGYRFAWQDDDDKVALLGGDPSADYGDNFNYCLAKYFEVNDLYVMDGKAPDVVNMSNIAYGFTRMLDAVYGDDVTCLNYWNEPVVIPDGSTTKNIFGDGNNPGWLNRYQTFELGSESYVANTIAMLSEWQDTINEGSETAWELIQEMLDMFYEPGKYDVSDHTSRNNY